MRIFVTGASAQAVEVVEGAAVDLGAGRLERCRSSVGPSKAHDLVSGVDELGDDRRPDPACRSGDEYAHGDASRGVMSVADITLAL